MLTVAVMAAVLGAGAPPKVAALEWNAVNVEPKLAQFYAEALAQALRAEGLKVVTSQDIATLLGMERQKQLLGCSDDQSSCMAELGSALGCDLVLAASLARLDESYEGTLKLLSATDGTVKSEVGISASSQKGLLDELKRAAKSLAAPLLGRPAPAPDVSVSQAPRRERRLTAKVVVPAVAGGALLAGAGVGFAIAGSNHARIATSDETAANTLAQEGQRAQDAAWVATGLGVAALATAAVLYFSGEPDPAVAPVAVVTPSGAAVGVVGRWP